MVGRLVRIAISVLATVALALFLSAPVLAQGGSSGGTTTSAGDTQYIDPLANPTTRHPKHKVAPKKASQHASSPAPSSTGSPAPSESAPPVQTNGGPATSGAVATGGGAAAGRIAAASHHRRKTSSSYHHKQAVARPAATHHAIATPAAASSSAAVDPPSHAGSSFPYVYLIVTVCVALGAALLGRRMLVRRAARGH